MCNEQHDFFCCTSLCTALKYISTSNPCIKWSIMGNCTIWISKGHWEEDNAQFPLEVLILKLLTMQTLYSSISPVKMKHACSSGSPTLIN